MRLADFQTPVENISTEQSLFLLEQNSEQAGGVVDWRKMKIAVGQGVLENWQQYARDTKGANSAQHLRLERLRYKKNGPYTASRMTALHDALDAMIAAADADPEFEKERDRNREDTESYSDEDEADPNEEEEEVSSDTGLRRVEDALRRFDFAVRRNVSRIPHAASNKPKPSSGQRSYATDADTALLAFYLVPDATVRDAHVALVRDLYPKNQDPILRGYLSGMLNYLAAFPMDAKVKDCKPEVLASTIRLLERQADFKRPASPFKVPHAGNRLPECRIVD